MIAANLTLPRISNKGHDAHPDLLLGCDKMTRQSVPLKMYLVYIFNEEKPQ